jgi:toxin ParE1/3/4
VIVHVDDRAEQDLVVAIKWYLRKNRRGVARSLLVYWSMALDRIAKAPASFPRIEEVDTDSRVRYWLFPKYDYRVIYLLDQDLATVIALDHTKRRPTYWQQRIDK